MSNPYLVVTGGNCHLYDTMLSPFVSLRETAKKIQNFYRYGGKGEVIVYIGGEKMLYLQADKVSEEGRLEELLLMAVGRYFLSIQ